MKTPWHLWAVGGASLLWHAGGAADYLMVRLGNPEYLAQMSAEQQAYIAAAPLWFDVAWALAIWTSVLGSVLVLLRSGLAVPVLAVALAGLLATLVHGLTAEPSPWTLASPMQTAFAIAVPVIAVLLVAYAIWMRRRGVLR